MRKLSLLGLGRGGRRVWAGAVALAVGALLAMPSVGHAGDAASSACPGPAPANATDDWPGRTPSADFPCLAAIDYLDDQGNVDSPQVILLVDPGLRRLVATGYGHTGFYQLEIDTPTGVPRQLSRTEIGQILSGANALDAEQHRLFLSIFKNDPSTHLSYEVITVRSLTDSFTAPLDFDLNAQSTQPLLHDASISALAYDAPHKVLYASTFNGVAMLEASAPDGKLTFKWFYPIPDCSLVGTYPYLGTADGGRLLYFACKGESTQEEGLSPVPAGVRVVDMGGPAPGKTDGFVTEFHPFAGDLTFAKTAGDPARDRLLIELGNAGNQRLYAFDVRRRAWTGSRPLADGNTRGVTVDPVTGRVYPVQEAPELDLVDAAQLPAPQGAPVNTGEGVGNAEQPAFDPVTRRLFLSGNFGTGYPEGLRVYQDNTPLPLPASPPDPDAATHDINESGAVSVSPSGEGSAFGTKAMFVGGFQQSAIRGIIAEFGSNAPKPGNREVFAADVSLAQLGAASAKAQAQGMSLDKATEDDFKANDGAGGKNYGSFKSQFEQFAPSACSDLGNPDDVRTQANSASSVTCAQGDSVSASASPSGPLDFLPVKVGYSHAEVTVVRDPVLGVIATSTAVTKGIDVAGGLHIGEIRSTAVSRAHGRRGTAKSVYSTSINQVRLADPTTGETKFACGWATENADDQNGRCDPTAVARAIDQFYNFQVHAEAGKRDKDVSTSNSPGGAQASVVKDPYSYWSDFNMNNDEGKEVYGLQLTFFSDNDQPSRLAVQLAGVRSEAKYAVGVAKPAIEPDATGSVDTAATTDEALNPLSLSAQDPSSQTTYFQQLGDNTPVAFTLPGIAKVIRRIFRQLAQGARFLVRHPAEAALFGMVWTLMGAPVYLARRRLLGSLVARAATI